MKNRLEVIDALVNQFGFKPGNFQDTKFWTYNRLLHYYGDLKAGRKPVPVR